MIHPSFLSIPINSALDMSLQPGSATAATLYQQQQQLQHLHQLQQLQQLHQQQLAAASAGVGVFPHPVAAFDAASALHAAALQQRLSASGSPGGHSTGACSTPASTLTIKEEENDSILGDSFHNQTTTTTATEEEEEEDDDIDVDDTASVAGGSARLPPPAHQHQQSKQSKPSLAFSISNILSDRFGDAASKQSKQGESSPAAASAAAAAAAAASIFRPFEANRAAAATPSAFTRVDLLEFSRQQQAAAAAATAAMMLERANLLNCFNPAAYPRIHEELVQSRLRRSANPNAVLPPTSAKHSSEPSAEKSALGSLCKAVSQIGQAPAMTPSLPVTPSSSSSAGSHLASPPPASNASTISSSSSSTATSSGSSSSSSSSGASSLNSSPSSRLAGGSASANNASSPQPIPPPSAVSRDSGMESSDDTRSETGSTTTEGGKNEMWPAWVYCTRYSDRPSSGRFIRPNWGIRMGLGLQEGIRGVYG